MVKCAVSLPESKLSLIPLSLFPLCFSSVSGPKATGALSRGPGASRCGSSAHSASRSTAPLKYLNVYYIALGEPGLSSGSLESRIMTHTFTRTGRKDISGTYRVVRGALDITSYTASGEVLSASTFGLKRIVDVEVTGLSDNGHVWRWDGTNIRAMKTDTSEGTATFTGTDGSAIVTETWGNFKGAEFDNQVTGSNTTDPVNGAYVHALAAVVTSVVNTGITNPDYPRNLMVQLRSAAGGTLPADCGTVTMIGTDQFDAAVTEVLALSPVNSVVLSAGGEVWVVGTKVFKTLTSYQFSVDLAATVADINGSVGIGTKLGLSKTMDPTSEAAIQRVFKNDTAIAAATYVGDGTYNALDMGADLADNDDVVIQYTVDSDAAGGSITTAGTAKTDVEASAADDVGEARVVVVGA